MPTAVKPGIYCASHVENIFHETGTRKGVTGSDTLKYSALKKVWQSSLKIKASFTAFKSQ